VGPECFSLTTDEGFLRIVDRRALREALLFDCQNDVRPAQRALDTSRVSQRRHQRASGITTLFVIRQTTGRPTWVFVRSAKPSLGEVSDK